MSLFSFGFSSSKRGATESRSETESPSTDADCPAGQPSASAERPAAKKKTKVFQVSWLSDPEFKSWLAYDVGRNHVELRDMQHGTSLADRAWGRSGNIKKNGAPVSIEMWTVIELFLLFTLAPWCSVSEPVCLFKSRTKLDHDKIALQGRGLVHFVGWPMSPLRRQWRSTRHACRRRWAAVRQGKINPMLGHLFCEKVAQRLHKRWMATIW